MKRTTDHHAIRRWVEERGGRPAVGPPGGDQPVPPLRVDFSTYTGDPGPKAISWDEFFARFEAERLALDYEEGSAQGAPIRVCRLVPR